MLAWILGLGSSVVAVFLVLLWFRWLEKCKRCGSWHGPRRTGVRDLGPISYESSMKCFDCGFRWTEEGSYIE